MRSVRLYVKGDYIGHISLSRSKRGFGPFTVADVARNLIHFAVPCIVTLYPNGSRGKCFVFEVWNVSKFRRLSKRFHPYGFASIR